MPLGTKLKRIWGETSRIERIPLFAAFGFRFLAGLLTWYAYEQGGFTERMPWTATLISKFGVPLGLSISLIISFVAILIMWVIWVSSRRRKPSLKLLRLLSLIFGYTAFFGFMALVFTDFASDVLVIFYNWLHLIAVHDFLFVAYFSCLLLFGTIYLGVDFLLRSSKSRLWRVKKK